MRKQSEFQLALYFIVAAFLRLSVIFYTLISIKKYGKPFIIIAIRLYYQIVVDVYRYLQYNLRIEDIITLEYK